MVGELTKALFSRVLEYKIDTLRYLSLYDNKYIRYFRGHKKRYVQEYVKRTCIVTLTLD